MPIVAATGTIVGSSPGSNPQNARDLEALMHAAVVQCTAEGVTDPAVILERKMAARERFQATLNQK